MIYRIVQSIAIFTSLLLGGGCSNTQSPAEALDSGRSGNATQGVGAAAGAAASASQTDVGAIAGAGGSNASTGASGGDQSSSRGGWPSGSGGGRTPSTGGAPAKGNAGGGLAGIAGTGGKGVSVSGSCKVPAWPSASGNTVVISGTKSVTNYDGKGALHEGNMQDCTSGNQDSVNPIIEVADGGSVKNVIFGKRIGDGIHCKGSCTIENVWFQYICDDAISMLGGSGKTMTILNSGFKGARDKVIQHNGIGSTVNIDNVYVDIAGKLYQSCGDGCVSGARSAKISNVIAIAANQVAGASTLDKVILSNICAYRTPIICQTYQPGSDNKASNGANGTSEGPSTNCVYQAADTHALVDRVVGEFNTDALCTGPSSAKSGTGATCVAGFERCLRTCTPGSYGFKELLCTNGEYHDSVKCALPVDAEVKLHLTGDNAESASRAVENNAPCQSQWAWGKDSSDSTHYCVCVEKPGYYQASSGWLVWDCQSPWWQ
jgi:hypothetical protein